MHGYALIRPGPRRFLFDLLRTGVGMTQTQIGQRLRISQMHVSRLRAHALGYLRSRLLDLEGTRAGTGVPASGPGRRGIPAIRGLVTARRK
jgi:hypothetical protein